MIRCKACGRFVKVAKVIVSGFDDVVSVVARCRKCGFIEDDSVIWTDYDELVSRVIFFPSEAENDCIS